MDNLAETLAAKIRALLESELRSLPEVDYLRVAQEALAEVSEVVGMRLQELDLDRGHN